MAHRILTHSIAVLGGVAFASAVFYGLLTQGYFAPPPPPRGDFETAKAAILTRLREKCGEQGLRGAFVHEADVKEDHLELVGTVDQSEQSQMLIDAATAALESNEEEWGRFFKSRPPQGKFPAYPLRSKLLPELRTLFAVGGSGIPEELVGKVRIEDAFTDAKGQVRIVGMVLDSAEGKPEEARSKVKKVVADFFRRNLPPDGKPLEPVSSEDDFQVAPGVRQKLNLAVAGQGISVWGLSFDAAALPVVKVLRSPKDRADGLLDDLTPALTAAGLSPNKLEVKLVDIRTEDQGLTAKLRKELAVGHERLGQQTRLDSIEVKPGDNRLVFICKGLCIHEGKPEVNIPALTKLLSRLLMNDTELKESDIVFDLEGMKYRPGMLVEVRQLRGKESDTSELRRVALKGLRFDPSGRLLVESDSAPALVEEFRTLVEKELLTAKPQEPEEQEEFVVATAAPPSPAPPETPFLKARRAIANNVADRELRYFRLDAHSLLDNDDNAFFKGVCITPLDKGKGLGKRVSLALSKAGLITKDELLANEATLTDKIKEEGYLEEPNLVRKFQKRIAGTKGMEGVLLFDAYYQREGKLRLIGILRDEKQRETLQKLLEAFEKTLEGLDADSAEKKSLEERGEYISPRVFRRKGVSAEGLDLSGLQVANLDLVAECQKALAAPSNEGLLRHTRIDHVLWERMKDQKKVGLRISGYCFHPNEGKDDESAQTGRIKKAIVRAIKDRIETLNKTAEFAEAPIPLPEDDFDLGELHAEKETFEKRLTEQILASETVKTATAEGVSLKGAVVTGAAFDEKGKLRLTGLVLEKPQTEELSRLAGNHFLAKTKDKNAPRLVTDAAGLKSYSNEELASVIQAALARDASTSVRRVFVERTRCECKKGTDEPIRLALHVSGITLGKVVKPHPSAGPISKAAAEYLVKMAPELESLIDVNLEQLKTQKNPETSLLATLQEKVAEIPELDGTLLTDVGYDEKGRLLVTGMSPSPVDHAMLLRDVVNKTYAKAIVLQPDMTPRLSEVKLTALTWKASAKTWPAMLSAIQTTLAANPAKGDPALSQSRIDRAYFVHDGDPAKAELRFGGLALYSARRDPNVRRKDQFKKAFVADKTAPLLLEAEFHDGYLAPLAKTLEVEAKRLLATPTFTTSVADVKLRVSPIAKAQKATDDELNRLGGDRQAIIDSFDFDAAGNLVPVVKLDAGKEVEAAATPEIQKAIETADRESGLNPLLPPFLRKGAKILWPSARKASTEKEELEVSTRADAADTPFLQLQGKVRKSLATASNSMAKSTWVAGMKMMNDGVNPITFRLEGVFLFPDRTSRMDIQMALPSLPEGWVFDVSNLKHEPDALPQLQNALADARIDGVVFRSARYTAEGTLELILAVNEVGQSKAVEARLNENAPLLRRFLAPGKSPKVVAETGLKKWSDLIAETTLSFLNADTSLEGKSLPLGRYTRLDRAALRLGQTWDLVELQWQGVSIYPGAGDESAIKFETLRRLKDSANLVGLIGATCEVKEDKKTGTTVLPNPKYLWQSGVSGEILPANDGILFEDAWYDKGKLRVSVLLARDTPAKESAQKNAVLQRIATTTVDSRVFALDSKKTDRPVPEFASRDFRSLLELVQRQVRASDPKLNSRVRIDRGYYLYPAARGQVELHVSGLLLQRSQAGDTPDAPAKEVTKLLEIIRKEVKAPRVSDRARDVVVIPQLTAILDLARYLQSVIKTVRTLDGVCLLDARFDGNDLRLMGKWAGKGQRAELLELCRDFIGRKRGDAIDPKSIRLDCDDLVSSKVLASLQDHAADALDETIVDRLFFDEFGVVNVSALSPRPDDTKTKLTAKLQALLVPVTGAADKAQMSIEPGDEAVKFLVAAPNVGVANLESVLGALRAEVQWPAKGTGNEGPDPKWNGMLVTRCYYTPTRKFGIQGLCDSEAQRETLAAHLNELSARGPFRGPLARGVELTRLRTVPLAPMLADLRRKLSSEEDFDGLSLVSAFHDVEGRLLLEVDLVGSLPPVRQARAEKLARSIVEKRTEWAERVVVGTSLRIRTRIEQEPVLAENLIRRATADLGLALAACPPGGPKWRPVGIPAQDYFAVTAAQLDRARLHAPSDSTLWYLRAMVNVLLDDDEAAERDIRRVHRIETDRIAGKARKLRRLGLIERVQGEARRLTEGLLRKADTVTAGR